MTRASDDAPRIVECTWGHIHLDDGSVHKDAKLYPGGAREWDWNETGTRHSPGIQPADVQELIDHGAKVIVLAKGVFERLQVSPETRQWLHDHDLDVRIMPTKAAVSTYNDLVNDGRSVGALIHSTC
ncbi:MAG: Mth938-like domain-containing protein [Candidatus Bipolaricaulia bacterium]